MTGVQPCALPTSGDRRTVCVFRNRKLSRGDQPTERSESILPAAPDGREATRPEKSVFESNSVCNRGRIVRRRTAIQRGVRLASAVRRLIDDLMITFAQVEWFQDVKVMLVLNFPVHRWRE